MTHIYPYANPDPSARGGASVAWSAGVFAPGPPSRGTLDGVARAAGPFSRRGVGAALLRECSLDPAGTVWSRLRELAHTLRVQIFSASNLGGADARVKIPVSSASDCVDLRSRRPQIWIHDHLDEYHEAFVLAHELAHVLISRPLCETDRLAPVLATGDGEEEQLCDWLAGLILLSPESVQVGERPDLTHLVDLALSLRVPVSTVAQRIAETKNVDVPLVLMRRSPTTWRPTRCAGLRDPRPTLPGYLDVPGLDRVSPGETVTLPVLVGTAREHAAWVSCQARVTDRGMAILMFRR